MQTTEQHLINNWRLKRLLRDLENYHGTATSMITLLIRPGTSISDVQRLLTEEYGTATNIKSRVNRQSVESAIISIQQRLKLYNKVPPNGLAIFCGTPGESACGLSSA